MQSVWIIHHINESATTVISNYAVEAEQFTLLEQRNLEDVISNGDVIADIANENATLIVVLQAEANSQSLHSLPKDIGGFAGIDPIGKNKLIALYPNWLTMVERKLHSICPQLKYAIANKPNTPDISHLNQQVVKCNASVLAGFAHLPPDRLVNPSVFGRLHALSVFYFHDCIDGLRRKISLMVLCIGALYLLHLRLVEVESGIHNAYKKNIASEVSKARSFRQSNGNGSWDTVFEKLTKFGKGKRANIIAVEWVFNPSGESSINVQINKARKRLPSGCRELGDWVTCNVSRVDERK